MKDRYELLKMTERYALVRDNLTGDIVMRAITSDALQILKWYNKHIPANN